MPIHMCKHSSIYTPTHISIHVSIRMPIYIRARRYLWVAGFIPHESCAVLTLSGTFPRPAYGFWTPRKVSLYTGSFKNFRGHGVESRVRCSVRKFKLFGCCNGEQNCFYSNGSFTTSRRKCFGPFVIPPWACSVLLRPKHRRTDGRTNGCSHARSHARNGGTDG